MFQMWYHSRKTLLDFFNWYSVVYIIRSFISMSSNKRISEKNKVQRSR